MRPELFFQGFSGKTGIPDVEAACVSIFQDHVALNADAAIIAVLRAEAEVWMRAPETALVHDFP